MHSAIVEINKQRTGCEWLAAIQGKQPEDAAGRLGIMGSVVDERRSLCGRARVGGRNRQAGKQSRKFIEVLTPERGRVRAVILSAPERDSMHIIEREIFEPMEKVQQLKSQLADVVHLQHAAALLGWDQQVNMPPGGAESRAEQLATLSKIAHQKFTSDEVGKLLDEAAAEVNGQDYASNDAALVRVVRHDYDLATKLPTELVEEIARTSTLAHEVWAKAREENNFPAFVPMLEKIYDLMRQQAEALGYEDRLYDALLDQYEPNMKTRDVERLFVELREELVPFVAAIFERLDAVDSSPVFLNYPEDKQIEFGLKVVKQIGLRHDAGPPG